MISDRVPLRRRLRFVLAAGESTVERAEAGRWTPPAHLVRRIHRERQEFLAGIPWRWMPPSWARSAAFALFGASDELYHLLDRDRKRWKASQTGRRPYWSPDARLRPREDDPEAVRRLLGRLDAREPE